MATLNTDNIFTFAVEVTEDYGNMEPTQTITVTLIEDPAKIKPVITAASVYIEENSLGNAAISFETRGTGDVTEYMIVDSAGSQLLTSPFIFENGFLSFKLQKPDYEALKSYEVDLQVKDNFGNLSEVTHVDVNITDVNEHYTFTSQTVFSPTEGASVAGLITVTPKTIIADAVASFSIATQSSDRFSIDETSGLLSFKTVSDFDDTKQDYTVTINVESQYNGSATESSSITVRVLPQERAITFTPQGVATVPEGIDAQVNIVATSADSNADITYTMQDGTDTSIFSIWYYDGQLDISVPSYIWSSDPNANVYRGAVVASDQYGNSKVQQGEMHVTTAVDGKPRFTTGNFTVAENTTAVGTVTAVTDIPSQPTLTYGIVGGTDSGLFNMTSAGVLSFKNIANYEDKTQYSLRLQVTDGIGHPDSATTQNIVINVINASDKPTSFTFDSGTTSATVDDGYHTFFVISHDRTSYVPLVATPSPSNGKLTYELTGDYDSSLFSIDNAKLKVVAPPRSSNKTYTLTIKVSEEKGEFEEKLFYLTIRDK